ncbi:hypothetical protein [Rubrobacter indicoceani]|uniref:hypothetical protein n=1 Tax=Rubrobacter indicoceani TaxID=2051957 RepID=UPI0013C49EFA|nr:hypothetical protein [Rubrobacter indicoceani]
MFDSYEDAGESTSLSSDDDSSVSDDQYNDSYEDEDLYEDESYEDEDFYGDDPYEETSFEDEYTVGDEESTSTDSDFGPESTMPEITDDFDEEATNEESTNEEMTGEETTDEESPGVTPSENEPGSGEEPGSGDPEGSDGDGSGTDGGSSTPLEKIPPQDPEAAPPAPGDQMTITIFEQTTTVNILDIYDGVVLCELPDGRTVEILLFDLDGDGWISFYECYICVCGWLGYRYYDYTPDQVYSYIGDTYNINISNTYEQTGAIRPTPVDRVRGVLPDTGGPALIGGAVGLAVVGAALIGRYSRRP